MRTHYCGQLRAEDVGQTVTLFGWVDRQRDQGGVVFLDLRDRTGVTQIVSDLGRTPDSFPIAEKLGNEDVVKIVGRVTQRPADSYNPRIETGEVEIYHRP